ncbi:hypothetical protein [Peromfec virus RodF8_60]|uniref:Uncharacterized protein n=1 Tax=Peromfec virus RodF8_60 TaxID=2929386 RepID=A0A976R783_9VIRU|nr:hypothetical protein [Peromfec virus RodF8_60]
MKKFLIFKIDFVTLSYVIVLLSVIILSFIAGFNGK